MIIYPNSTVSYKSKKSAEEITEATVYPTILRAVCKKKKYSTLVHSTDLLEFTTAYSNLAKLYMGATLKKKDRREQNKKRKLNKVENK